MLEIELRDKKKMVEGLRRALQEQRGREQQLEEQVARGYAARMEKQKSDYEGNLERQLAMVDRLLQDKAELTKKCETLADEVKTVEKNYEHKLHEIQSQIGSEVNRQKGNWSIQEKLRRENWEREKVSPKVERTLPNAIKIGFLIDISSFCACFSFLFKGEGNKRTDN